MRLGLVFVRTCAKCKVQSAKSSRDVMLALCFESRETQGQLPMSEPTNMCAGVWDRQISFFASNPFYTQNRGREAPKHNHPALLQGNCTPTDSPKKLPTKNGEDGGDSQNLCTRHPN